jgi:hypothetical protein
MCLLEPLELGGDTTEWPFETAERLQITFTCGDAQIHQGIDGTLQQFVGPFP